MNDTRLEGQVHDALHLTADSLHRSPLTVGDVRTRARRIRRRRTITTGAAVAAVLAITVPVGLNLTGPVQRSGVQPAAQSPAPVIAGTIRIEPRNAPTSASLAAPLLDVDTPSLIADGEVTELPETYVQLTPYLEGWIGVVENEGAYSWRQLDADFQVVDETATASQLAVSADGSRIAWAEHDNTRWYVVDVTADGTREERRTPLPAGPAEAKVEVVGFSSDTEVVVTQMNPADGVWTTLRVDGSAVTPVPGFVRPSSASSATGAVAGVIRVLDDLSTCSAVIDAQTRTGEVAWDTCDHTLAAFSPDGRYVVGLASYLDPNGSPTLAVLDAATGETVVDYELIGPRNSLIGINDPLAWEDEDSIIVTLYSKDRQFVVRLGLDGTVERITAPGTELELDRPSLRVATN